MCKLIENNIEHNYQIYSSQYIIDHHRLAFYEGKYAHARFRNRFPNNDSSTWTYQNYNIFSLAAGSVFFYKIYKDLIFVIKNHVNTNEPIWFESWLNFHKETEVLDWHNHAFSYHGYISIDPKNTTTEFKNYSIENQIGNIYIGPGRREHRVLVNHPYDGTRITLGFNIIKKADAQYATTCNIGAIPII
jgi:hypothetical protein